MVEYGHGVGQATGLAGGGGGGGGSVDLGAEVSNFISNAGHTISTMPPAQLLFLAFVVIAGLVVLKRAL